MFSAPHFFEYGKYCPQLACGEVVGSGADSHFCQNCGKGYQLCGVCGATNRLFVACCRGCGERMLSETWPLHPGLRERELPRQSIRSLGRILSATLDMSVVAAPIALDELIIVAGQEGDIVLLRGADGSHLARISTFGPIEVTPAIEGLDLFVAAGAKLVALDLMGALEQQSGKDIKPLWTFESRNGVITQPLLVGKEAVYLVTSDGSRGALEAVSQVNGKSLWSQPLVPPTSSSSVVFLEGLLLLVTGGGEVQVLEPSDGSLVGALRLDRNVDSAVTPCVVGSQVLFADQMGSVFKIVVGHNGPRSADVFGHGTRILSIAANAGYIMLGHLAGVTLLDSHGQFKWSDTRDESVSVPAILAGDRFFVLDDVGKIRLYGEPQSNPLEEKKVLPGGVNTPPLMMRTRVAAVNSEGSVALIGWQ